MRAERFRRGFPPFLSSVAPGRAACSCRANTYATKLYIFVNNILLSYREEPIFTSRTNGVIDTSAARVLAGTCLCSLFRGSVFWSPTSFNLDFSPFLSPYRFIFFFRIWRLDLPLSMEGSYASPLRPCFQQFSQKLRAFVKVETNVLNTTAQVKLVHRPRRFVRVRFLVR